MYRTHILDLATLLLEQGCAYQGCAYSYGQDRMVWEFEKSDKVQILETKFHAREKLVMSPRSYMETRGRLLTEIRLERERCNTQ